MNLTNITTYDSCGDLILINNIQQRCHLIKTTELCEYDGILVNSIEFIYCQFNGELIWSCTILLLLLFILFVTIGLVADDFLCPSLLTISKTLRLPDNMAGVTLLAFGNGAPDIFSSLNGISKSKPYLIFASLFGAGIFVTTIIVGSIILTGNFSMNRRPLVRDIVFYIGATFLAWLYIYDRTFTMLNAISFIVLYLVYLLVIFMSRLIYLRTQKSNGNEHRKSLENNNVDIFQVIPKPSTNPPLESVNRVKFIDDYEFDRSKHVRSLSIIERRRTFSQPAKHLVHHHWYNTIRSLARSIEFPNSIFDKNDRSDLTSNEQIDHNNNNNIDNNGQNTRKFSRKFSMIEMMSETKNFLFHICPIDISEWKELSPIKKIFEMIKAIPYFILIISIPVVDLESLNGNWCRLLYCLNILIAPQIILFLKQINCNIFDNFPLWSFLLIISLILIILIFFTSDKTNSPVYHRLFAIIGFVASISFIHMIAEEIISILQTFGMVFRLSDEIVGLTVLAWGNSVGDLLSNLSMARHGYHSMAIAACFGGPLFNLLIGLGVPYIALFIRNKDKHNMIHIKYTDMISLLYASLSISLCTSLLMFTINKFQSSRLHGYLLLFIYVMYLILAVLFEFQIIKI